MFAPFICTLDPQRSRNVMFSFQFELVVSKFSKNASSLLCVSWIGALMCSAAGFIGAL